ncbi:MAG: ABC transporter permease [SAR202 cluster bacterium]|jgi:peptide/nickel transport system permease protein|nr:ABC transporter permease [SAR202 cluster bacterium]
MGRYVIQRLLAAIPVLFIVAIITFSLIHITPGDPATLMAGDQALPEQIAAIKAKLGLDKPMYQQLGSYFADILRGDLGESVFTKFKVTELIKQRLPPSLFIAIYSQVFAILVAIPLGILAAWKANTWIDRVAMIFAVMGLALPSFWLGFNLMWLFAVKLSWFPAIGYEPLTEGVIPWIKSLTLPSLTVGMISAALITRMTRSTMLEVLREDYIRTARAKGLREFPVLFRHGFKNASIPVVTIIGLSFAGLVGGLVVTEAVFAIPGVGRLVVDAVLRRDYAIIQGTTLMVTVAYVMINLIVDVIYGYLDPRIRY